MTHPAAIAHQGRCGSESAGSPWSCVANRTPAATASASPYRLTAPILDRRGRRFCAAAPAGAATMVSCSTRRILASRIAPLIVYSSRHLAERPGAD